MRREKELKSIHPYKPFIPVDSNKLIIGTIPPPRFCTQYKEIYKEDVNFYYGSRDNAFWPIIENVFDIELEYSNSKKAISERKNFLTKHGIGISDIIDKCIHKNDSAADEDLTNIEHKDLGELLRKNPQISILIYTSEFVKKQMNLHFNTYHSINKENRKIQSIIINGTKYNVRILYSPSPNALRNLGKQGSKKREKQYKEFILE
ncbi:hypothetical protein HZR84_09875 [Hyphobacterium sp. CCMP332]|nr:hypothetical protein HZR84_09875 [Hyphobacterium sp. CCMP332]